MMEQEWLTKLYRSDRTAKGMGRQLCSMKSKVEKFEIVKLFSTFLSSILLGFMVSRFKIINSNKQKPKQTSKLPFPSLPRSLFYFIFVDAWQSVKAKVIFMCGWKSKWYLMYLSTIHSRQVKGVQARAVEDFWIFLAYRWPARDFK